MRVRLEHPDRAPFWLIGQPGANAREQSPVNKDGLQIRRDQQVAGGAGWDSKVGYDRKNQWVSYTADAVWEFANLFAAMDFLASLAPVDVAAQRHAWHGDIWLREEDGTSWREWLLPDAIISLQSADLSGVSVQLRYQIQAAGFGGSQSGQTVEALLAYEGKALPARSFLTADVWETAYSENAFLVLAVTLPDGEIGYYEFASIGYFGGVLSADFEASIAAVIPIFTGLYPSAVFEETDEAGGGYIFASGQESDAVPLVGETAYCHFHFSSTSGQEDPTFWTGATSNYGESEDGFLLADGEDALKAGFDQ